MDGKKSVTLGHPCARLSVVVAAARPDGDLETCLRPLVEHCLDGQVELVVAGCVDENSAKRLKAEYSRVVLLPFPERTPLPLLWSAGIRQAGGSVIAITDSTTTPDGDRIPAILHAHEGSDMVIGGVVEAAADKKCVDWAAYFCEYGRFMRPLKGGVVTELPGNNVSFRRSALEKGRQFVENGFWKSYWCRALQQQGIPLVSVPSIVVYCRKSYRLLPFLIRRFHHGRCFAGMRIDHASLLQRGLFIAGSPGLPLIFVVRTIRNIIPKRRFLKEFVISFPVSLLAIVSWSAGELWGYLTGPGRSCARVY